MIEALINTQYESIRGFNYQPSYDFSGLTIWREFRQDVVAVELERGKKYFPGMNTIRAWLSWDAFLENPKRFAANFDALLEIAAGNGLRVIPTLFNGWHSIPNFGGIVVGQLLLLKNVDYWDIFLRYISELVGGHANDERILMWDLCNEPINNPDVKNTVLDWLTWLAEQCRGHRPRAPICVGNNSMELMKLTDPFTNVLTYHHYYAPNTVWGPKTEFDFVAQVDETVRFANARNKPFLVTETCWGSLDDAERARTGQFELQTLADRGIGFTAHLLHHSLVADAHRPEHGPVTEAGNMAFIEADGSLRPGHEFFNEF